MEHGATGAPAGEPPNQHHRGGQPDGPMALDRAREPGLRLDYALKTWQAEPIVGDGDDWEAETPW